MNIFVGNLLFEATEADVKSLFEGFGDVASVAIVMEKKGVKSRGFGFVEMLDEAQAKTAIAALDGKDFMGRVLNVSPAHPKKDKSVQKKRKVHIKVKAEVHDSPREFVSRPGQYMGGRRTRSYMMKRVEEGVSLSFKPRRKSNDNPMRWRKKKDQSRPWQKNNVGSRPWEKSNGESKPWKKAKVEAKSWKKPEEGFKSWKKTSEGSRPWQKNSTGAKPWEKSAGESKPWGKPRGESKTWHKSSERITGSGFKGHKKWRKKDA